MSSRRCAAETRARTSPASVTSTGSCLTRIDLAKRSAEPLTRPAVGDPEEREDHERLRSHVDLARARFAACVHDASSDGARLQLAGTPRGASGEHKPTEPMEKPGRGQPRNLVLRHDVVFNLAGDLIDAPEPGRFVQSELDNEAVQILVRTARARTIAWHTLLLHGKLTFPCRAPGS
jgi:hypothetical protein